MPLVLPERADREDYEKFAKAALAGLAAPDRVSIDRQDYSPIVATTLAGTGYINDEDVYTFIRKSAATVP